jgi:hypothetical protein
MHGALAAAAAAAQRLAIEGHDLAGQTLAQTLGPEGEGFGELRGVERGKDPPKGVVAGDAAGQFEESAQPLVLGTAKVFHVHEALRFAEQRAERDEQDVVEAMDPAPFDARIFELAEVMADAVGVGHPEFLPTLFPKVHS